MQKRDKYGRFLKGKVVNKKAKKPKKNCAKKVTIQKVTKVPKNHKIRLADMDVYDLQDLIQAEVMFQMKDFW